MRLLSHIASFRGACYSVQTPIAVYRCRQCPLAFRSASFCTPIWQIAIAAATLDANAVPLRFAGGSFFLVSACGSGCNNYCRAP
jgi:hypothetical protein